MALEADTDAIMDSSTHSTASSTVGDGGLQQPHQSQQPQQSQQSQQPQQSQQNQQPQQNQPTPQPSPTNQAKPSAPASGGVVKKAPAVAGGAGGAGGSGGTGGATTSREQSQLAKLREANAKYKNLLKLAKERIQEQEGVLDERRSEVKQLTTQLKEATQQIDTLQHAALTSRTAPGSSGPTPNDLGDTTIVRVCQRIKEEIDDHDGPAGPADSPHEIGDMDTPNNANTTNTANNHDEESFEIWALIEYETATPDTDALSPSSPSSYRRYKQWRKFTTESSLSDYIRRDTGEPLTLPPYSLSPDQSQTMAEEAKKAVASISEEFRRFRVRAEVAKKQADATVRALHSSSVHKTRMRIEGQDIESELAQAKTDHAQLAALRAELTEQEARWKESYDLLLAENEKLKSSGAEALLAAQWRHRYEACLKEKEDALTNLEMEREKVLEMQDQRRKMDAGKYENKYRDLKESFRLYRKKAKEIFLAQQQGDTGFLPTLHDSGAELAKVSYLKNLMVNYLASDSAVREHMEPAIATVLNFTDDDLAKIKKQKDQSDSWF